MKLENIILDSSSKILIKLIDFGLAVKQADADEITFCGTPYSQAPEVVTAKTQLDLSDMWSVGVISYNLLVGRAPFEATTRY